MSAKPSGAQSQSLFSAEKQQAMASSASAWMTKGRAWAAAKLQTLATDPATAGVATGTAKGWTEGDMDDAEEAYNRMMQDMLERHRRDRRDLLVFLLTSSSIVRPVLPPGASSLREVDLDRVNVQYVLQCAAQGPGTVVDLAAALAVQQAREHEDTGTPSESPRWSAEAAFAAAAAAAGPPTGQYWEGGLGGAPERSPPATLPQQPVPTAVAGAGGAAVGGGDWMNQRAGGAHGASVPARTRPTQLDRSPPLTPVRGDTAPVRVPAAAAAAAAAAAPAADGFDLESAGVVGARENGDARTPTGGIGNSRHTNKKGQQSASAQGGGRGTAAGHGGAPSAVDVDDEAAQEVANKLWLQRTSGGASGKDWFELPMRQVAEAVARPLGLMGTDQHRLEEAVPDAFFVRDNELLPRGGGGEDPPPWPIPVPFGSKASHFRVAAYQILVASAAAQGELRQAPAQPSTPSASAATSSSLKEKTKNGFMSRLAKKMGGRDKDKDRDRGSNGSAASSSAGGARGSAIDDDDCASLSSMATTTRLASGLDLFRTCLEVREDEEERLRICVVAPLAPPPLPAVEPAPAASGFKRSKSKAPVQQSQAQPQQGAQAGSIQRMGAAAGAGTRAPWLVPCSSPPGLSTYQEGLAMDMAGSAGAAAAAAAGSPASAVDVARLSLHLLKCAEADQFPTESHYKDWATGEVLVLCEQLASLSERSGEQQQAELAQAVAQIQQGVDRGLSGAVQDAAAAALTVLESTATQDAAAGSAARQQGSTAQVPASGFSITVYRELLDCCVGGRSSGAGGGGGGIALGEFQAEVLPLLRRHVWPALGIDEPLHCTVLAWVLLSKMWQPGRPQQRAETLRAVRDCVAGWESLLQYLLAPSTAVGIGNGGGGGGAGLADKEELARLRMMLPVVGAVKQMLDCTMSNYVGLLESCVPEAFEGGLAAAFITTCFKVAIQSRLEGKAVDRQLACVRNMDWGNVAGKASPVRPLRALRLQYIIGSLRTALAEAAELGKPAAKPGEAAGTAAADGGGDKPAPALSAAAVENKRLAVVISRGVSMLRMHTATAAKRADGGAATQATMAWLLSAEERKAVACAVHGLVGRHVWAFLPTVRELSRDVCSALKGAGALDELVWQVLQADDKGEQKQLGRLEGRERGGAVGEPPFILYPFHVDTVLAGLFVQWVSEQEDKLTLWTERGLLAETWEPLSETQCHAASVVDAFRLLEDAFEHVFELGLPLRVELFRELAAAMDRVLLSYLSSLAAQVGSKEDFSLPPPPLTRYKRDVAEGLMKKVMGGGGTLSRWSLSTKERDPMRLFTSKQGAKQGAVTLQRREALAHLTVGALCVRINTCQFAALHIASSAERLVQRWNDSVSLESDKIRPADLPQENVGEDSSSSSSRAGTPAQAAAAVALFPKSYRIANAAVDEIAIFMATKAVWWDLREVLLEGLYRMSVGAARLHTVMQSLDVVLNDVVDVVDESLRNRVVHHLLHSVLEGLLRVLLDGGPLRVFAESDGEMLEEDVENLMDFFIADGHGLPAESVERAFAPVQQILNYYCLDTSTVIEAFKDAHDMKPPTLHGSDGRDAVTGVGCRTVPPSDVLLRVLCHRADHSASKFLKDVYKLPKSI